MARTILVVDDEPTLRETLVDALETDGFRVVSAADGREALTVFRAERPDLVLLDLMLPELSGVEVCRIIRSESSVPIVMLTAKDSELDKVVGLELGADDYVTKPFSPKELTARVSALLRRLQRSAAPGAVLRYGSISIDTDRHLVTVGETDVRLTAKEFLLLLYLVQHRGRVLSRDLLLTDVWGYQYTGGTRTVDVHIRRLREKVPVLATAIETVKQFGYKLVEQGG
jgi:DNA-binding response OmpR family regulator